MYGFTQEYLLHKIEAIERMCRKTSELMTMLNDELYAMHIPHHALMAWNMLQTVHSICRKLCLKYTNFSHDTESSTANVDSLQCVKETQAMLLSINYCIWNNPKENIKAASLNLIGRLLKRSYLVIEAYLAMIERTHRNVQAE